MGDHRASIKIEFSMYGETKKADMWINWSPDGTDYHGVDQRVLDFFYESACAMKANFCERHERAMRIQQEKAEIEAERKEYERLKVKFEKEKANV